MHSRLKVMLAAGGLAAVLAIGPTLIGPAAASDTLVVRAGDTLSGIAARQGVTVGQLVALNRLTDPNRIYAGQTLRLRPVARPPAPSGTAARPAAIAHVVRPGETLTGIAVRYGTTIGAIATANGLADVNRISAGQRLVIPGAPPVGQAGRVPTSGPPATLEPLTHRVQPGETLTGIARRYRITIGALAGANRITNPSFVRAGVLLRIPGTIAAATARSARVMPAGMMRLVARRAAIGNVVRQEARNFGVPAAFALAVAWHESGWQQGVTSSAGAIGVMQLLPATGDWVGPAMLGRQVNLRDTRQNVRAGVRLLRHYLDRYHNDKPRTLAAYYQGQTAVDRHGIYPVSRPYIASILYLEKLFG